MLKIDLITRAYEGEINGLSRYDRALYDGLNARCDIDVTVRPIKPAGNRMFDQIKNISGMDIAAFLGVYPLRLPRIQGDLGHLTTSSHATALLWKQRIPVVVTVHDIIHFTYRHDRRLSTYRHIVQRLADTLALRNLRYADAIIASSAFTKQQLIHYAGLEPEQISVVPLGIDCNRFRPCEVPPAFYEKYGLNSRTPYVLHISSEEPRKNIETLLRAWVHVQKQQPDAILLKVGRCLYPAERIRLLKLIADLGIGETVRFIDLVPDQDLPLFYNAASVFVFPSLAEGFGFPVLEAMACGLPVVCSTAPALTELVADVALQHEATDVAALASHICLMLCNPDRCQKASTRGLERAIQFSWKRTVDQTCCVYNNLMVNHM
jgi:glycosyltransferase involved in cell wall biosynthesis